MSIKFFIPSYTNEHLKRASYRFRATIPLKGMRDIDGIISDVNEATKDDIVVLAKKSSPKNVRYLKSKGIKCVYDICDNKWRKQIAPNWVEKVIQPHNEITNNVNAIITTCESMRSLILENSNRDSIIINDPVEAVKVEPNLNFDGKIKIFNYGSSKHFNRVDWQTFCSKLDELGIDYEINCMLDRVKKFKDRYLHLDKLHMHEYNFNKQYTFMRECDIVFLPIIIRSPDEAIDIRSKSPNRIIDAIQSGKPVITNAGIESYNPFMPFAFFTTQNYENYARTLLNLINMKKEFIYNKIVEGQKYIEQNHSPEVIGKQWIELENKV